MKGDFTRNTFDTLKHFSRVLMQQGRVTLDADYNEQSAILLHYLRTLARDVIGPYAGPIEHNGFMLSYDTTAGLKIGAGRYYVNGILVENNGDCSYDAQPDYPVPDDDALFEEINNSSGTGKVFWVYLDVWERHITALEDDSIREKALGGPDTCTRAKVVWQVKALLGDWPTLEYGSAMTCAEPLGGLVSISKALLAARVDPGMKTEDPCVTPPASKYRGAENQLYRVEIHRGGVAWNGGRDEKGNPAGNIDEAATFKWSRDNGSVVTAWLGVSGNDIQVARARGFGAGNWVELSDDNSDLLGNSGTLVNVAKVEGDTLTVDPSATLPTRSDDSRHPEVRRWDHVATDAISLADDNAVPIQESPAGATPEQIVWIDLEDGVQIQFSTGGEYRSGDYWLIPARVAAGNVEWPSDLQEGKMISHPLPPHGVEHHYAPLGFVQWSNEDKNFTSCRCEFEPLSSCFSMGSIAVGAHLLRPTARPPQAAPAAKPARKRKRRS
jgi:hypothetical protein